MRRLAFTPTLAAALTACLAVSPAVIARATVPESADVVRAGSDASPPPDEVHVEVTDFRFTPATVTLSRGGTIVFDHLGPSHHTATDATGMLLYDSGPADETSPPTSYTFTAAGTYPFVCTPHPFMGGRVSVPVRVAPASGSARRSRTIRFATIPAPAGFVYDVQIRRPRTGWATWLKGSSEPASTFRPDAGKGPYRFRARLREFGVAASRWSQPAVTEVV